MRRVDLTGRRFGRLVVIGSAKRDNYHNAAGAMWRCQCDCGNQVDIPSARLRTGNTKSCGCLRSERSRERAGRLHTAEDLTGKNLYGLDVIRPEENPGGSKRYICRCTLCGKEISAKSYDIRTGNAHLRCPVRKADLRKVNSENNAFPSEIRPGGVCFSASSGRWVAYLSVNGRQRIVYQGHDANEANRMRQEALMHHADFESWFEGIRTARKKKESSNVASGCRGVVHLKNGKWRAQIQRSKKVYTLYYGDDKEEAIRRRHEAESLDDLEFSSWIAALRCKEIAV